tara:strand:- start:58 stop:1098 length:1041 start_codon:yes stop_codon:yes gene_type:complete
MSRDTYSSSKLFIGDKLIPAFTSVQFTENGKNQASSLNVSIPDPSLKYAALNNKEITFYLNYGGTDAVPFFRGRIRQANPTDKVMNIVAYDVRTFLTGKESIPLSLTDSDNFDGHTLGQFLQAYIEKFVNVNETVIGLDMLNDTNPVSTLSGIRGDNMNALSIVDKNMPTNSSDLTEILSNRLIIVDDGTKSNICFVKEQSLNDAAIRFGFGDGVKSLSVKKRPKPNIFTAKVNDTNVIYKHNNLSTGIAGGKIKTDKDKPYRYPDEAVQAAFIQATKAEEDLEISITTTKGHYLNIGNVINLQTPDYPECIGKHRIVSKQVTCSTKDVNCILQLTKEKPRLNEYL